MILFNCFLFFALCYCIIMITSQKDYRNIVEDLVDKYYNTPVYVYAFMIMHILLFLFSPFIIMSNIFYFFEVRWFNIKRAIRLYKVKKIIYKMYPKHVHILKQMSNAEWDKFIEELSNLNKK